MPTTNMSILVRFLNKLMTTFGYKLVGITLFNKSRSHDTNYTFTERQMALLQLQIQKRPHSTTDRLAT